MLGDAQSAEGNGAETVVSAEAPTKGISQFNPTSPVGDDGGSKADGAAEAGGSDGGPAGAEAQGGTELAELQQQLAAAEKRMSEQQKLLDEAVGRRQKTAQTSAEKIEALQKQVEQLEQANIENARQGRRRSTVEAVISKIPAAHHALAKLAIQGLQHDARPIDLAGEDQSATQKAIVDRLQKEHPTLFQDPKGQPRAPRIQSASPGNNGIPNTNVGAAYATRARTMMFGK